MNIFYTLSFGFILAIVARFERELYVYNENVGQGRVGVVLSGRSAEDINLEYVTMDGTATGKLCTINLSSPRVTIVHLFFFLSHKHSCS